MATVSATREDLKSGLNVAVYTWAGIATGDTINAISIPDYADLTVQISGTFGGATVKLQGSNDDDTYVDLTDPQGNAISKTDVAIEAVTETPRYIKPAISGGTSDAVDIILLCRRGTR